MSQARAAVRVAEELGKIAGQPVEITIRGETEFTWSLAKPDHAAGERLAAFAKKDPRVTADVQTFEDDGTGTFVYLSIDLSDEKRT